MNLLLRCTERAAGFDKSEADMCIPLVLNIVGCWVVCCSSARRYRQQGLQSPVWIHTNVCLW